MWWQENTRLVGSQDPSSPPAPISLLSWLAPLCSWTLQRCPQSHIKTNQTSFNRVAPSRYPGAPLIVKSVKEFNCFFNALLCATEELFGRSLMCPLAVLQFFLGLIKTSLQQHSWPYHPPFWPLLPTIPRLSSAIPLFKNFLPLSVSTIHTAQYNSYC